MSIRRVTGFSCNGFTREQKLRMAYVSQASVQGVFHQELVDFEGGGLLPLGNDPEWFKTTQFYPEK